MLCKFQNYDFDEAAPDYNFACKNSGYNESVTYIPSPSK